MSAPDVESERRMLAEHLTSAERVARRLEQSVARVAGLMPLDARTLTAMPQADADAIDALLFRFNSLAGLIQDHVIRALLVVQEEEVRERSRKDQRLLMEKRGALPQGIDFGGIARLRNRVTHQYPSDPDRHAGIVNDVFSQASDLLAARAGIDGYARRILAADAGDGVARPDDPP